jgi:hypothetical protein
LGAEFHDPVGGIQKPVAGLELRDMKTKSRLRHLASGFVPIEAGFRR